MVWGAFSSKAKSELCILNSRLNAERYCNVLEEYLLPFAYAEHGHQRDDFIFMHDGATCHIANITRDYLNQCDIEVMDWPAVSPDLNPIENIWGILVQRVYENGRQFQTVNQLRSCVMEQWNSLQQFELEPLTDSMTDRCIAVLQKNGGPTKY